MLEKGEFKEVWWNLAIQIFGLGHNQPCFPSIIYFYPKVESIFYDAVSAY
jgi:hypothetical protein